MLKNELKKSLQEIGIPIVKGNYLRKKDVREVLAKTPYSQYAIPAIPNDLKHAKTEREKQYLKIIDELLEVIKKDPMTGLTHKEHFRTIERPAGVYILVDGDGLKKINDTFGHTAGHAAILAISDGIKAVLRQKDNITVTRSGGDEFIVHVEHVSTPTGIAIANRILESIRKQKISKHFHGDAETKARLDELQLTASLGVGYTEEEADKALYKAKEKGRNRVEFHKPAFKKKEEKAA